MGVTNGKSNTGMGNRFRNMDGYHSLVRAHGVIAAIVFLFLVPVSVLLVRFSPVPLRLRSRTALRLHIYAQVLTLFLSTVVFVTGWFAVGPKRSLTNPHHGIGLAIYVMVIFQVLWGYMVHRTRRHRRWLAKLRLMVWLSAWLVLSADRLLTDADPPMAWSLRATAGPRPDPAGSDFVRLAQNPFYPLQPRRSSTAGSLLRTVIFAGR